MDTEHIKAFVIAGHGNLAQVKSLLAETPELLNAAFEWRPGDFEDALAGAAHVGNREIAEYLLAQGAPMTIFAAAMLGRTEDVMRMLDENPALVNAPGAHGISLLFHAAQSADVALLALLKERGCTGDYDHALHAAISRQNAAVVGWLLANGVTNPNRPDFQGKTPLQRAHEAELTEIATLLTQHGAQPEE